MSERRVKHDHILPHVSGLRRREVAVAIINDRCGPHYTLTVLGRLGNRTTHQS